MVRTFDLLIESLRLSCCPLFLNSSSAFDPFSSLSSSSFSCSSSLLLLFLFASLLNGKKTRDAGYVTKKGKQSKPVMAMSQSEKSSKVRPELAHLLRLEKQEQNRRENHQQRTKPKVQSLSLIFYVEKRRGEDLFLLNSSHIISLLSNHLSSECKSRIFTHQRNKKQIIALYIFLQINTSDVVISSS